MKRRRNSLHKRYINQRYMAHRRGLAFSFSFKEWCKWWLDQLGPEWPQLRGRRRHQYCMARIADKGAYEPKHVRCIKCRDNHRERIPNRTNVKLTEDQARDILYSEMHPKDLAAKHGATIENVYSIKRRLSWRHL